MITLLKLKIALKIVQSIKAISFYEKGQKIKVRLKLKAWIIKIKSGEVEDYE